MIELINVSKKYVTKAGDTNALNNVSIKFDDKGLVFIVGKSGCGKTTLLNVIGGLDSLDSGDIIIDGKKFSEFSPSDYDSYRNTLVGFVFQEYNLLSDYNIEKNIDIANELQGKKAKEEDIQKLLSTVEIGGYEKRKPYQLSGGQKQRASIARALIKNPKIVLADEPTGALDSATGVQVMSLLKELSKEKLIVVVSHEMEFAEKYADRIIRLVDGQVVEDITQRDIEITDVVHEFEEELVVKAGSDLSDEDTKKLAKAIKERKKINITEKICIKQKEKTKEIESQNSNKESIKFIHSKMKLKSVAGLGLKSLLSKPVRLIFTVLLSIIAFAVFGVFDAVGSFNDERALISLLNSDNYQTVSIYAGYNNYGYNNAEFKFSQNQLKKLNKETNYSFRGIYDIKDQQEYSYGTKERENFNKSHAINDKGISGTLTVGGDYYYKEFDGIVEFKQSEIVNNFILPREFNYEIVYGEYPTLKTQDEQFQGVGISSYMARNIIRYMQINNTEEFGGKRDVKSIGDLIGARLGISTINTKTFVISAIIDCGDIPQKYSKLKEATDGQMYALSQDFITFINSGCHLSLFLPDGYVQNVRETYNRKTAYFADYSETDYEGTQTVASKSQTRTASPYYYNINEFDSLDSIMFADIENDRVSQGSPSLESNEALVSINNLRLLFNEEYYKNGGKYQAKIISITDAILAEKTVNGKREKTKELFEFMKEIYNDTDYKFTSKVYRKNIKLSKIIGDKTEDIKTVYIVGFYFDTNKDNLSVFAKENSYDPLVLSSQGLSSLGVSTNQGIYSRAVSALKDNSRGAEILGNMLVDTDGFMVRWYNNSMIESLADNEEFLNQLLQLFLYVSLIIIVFSMFMLMNYITTSITSKRHTIGILRALGAKGKNIFIMFLIESMIIALINGIFASVVGYVAGIFVNKYILDIMNMTISFALFGIRQVLIILGVSLATGFVSSLLPIIKIIKEKPVALIRKNS